MFLVCLSLGTYLLVTSFPLFGVVSAPGGLGVAGACHEHPRHEAAPYGHVVKRRDLPQDDTMYRSEELRPRSSEKMVRDGHVFFKHDGHMFFSNSGVREKHDGHVFFKHDGHIFFSNSGVREKHVPTPDILFAIIGHVSLLW